MPFFYYDIAILRTLFGFPSWKLKMSHKFFLHYDAVLRGLNINLPFVIHPVDFFYGVVVFLICFWLIPVLYIDFSIVYLVLYSAPSNSAVAAPRIINDPIINPLSPFSQPLSPLYSLCLSPPKPSLPSSLSISPPKTSLPSTAYLPHPKPSLASVLSSPSSQALSALYTISFLPSPLCSLPSICLIPCKLFLPSTRSPPPFPRTHGKDEN